MTTQSLKMLNTLQVGDSAIIDHYDHAHAHEGHKLMALGLTPGTPIEVTRLSPFSDPMIIRLRGFKLSLRKADLAGIWVSDIHEK